jgi:hypothetical protein
MIITPAADKINVIINEKKIDMPIAFKPTKIDNPIILLINIEMIIRSVPY